MDEWKRLEEPWRVSFAGAWEAFLSGSIPVGAAVAAADGTVVAHGRSRIFDPPGRGLSGSRLAHAEVDALAKLSSTARYRDHALYSTLEPCLLCVAATLIATVGRIEYAAPDPWAGACVGTIETVHWQRSAPEIGQPAGGWSGRVSAVLQSAFFQKHSDHPRAAQIITAFGDEARAAGKRLLGLQGTLPQDFQEALPQLLACIE